MPSPSEQAIPSDASDLACIDLINSRFSDHLGKAGVIDRLPDPVWQSWFLDRYELRPSESADVPIASLDRLRVDVAWVLDHWAQGRRMDRRVVSHLDGWTGASAMRRRVLVAGGRVSVRTEAVADDWSWTMCRIALSAAELMAGGEPGRYKRCGNPDCSWVYYDATLNSSKQYCSTNPCGTLMRVRRHRAALD